MTTFRASPPNNIVDQNMGLLAQLPGHWVGHGFNLFAKPHRQNGGLFDLELNATKEIQWPHISVGTLVKQ